MAERHVSVGEEPIGFATLEGALELDREPPATLTNLPAQALERRARVVGHTTVGVERAAKPIGELIDAW